MLHRHDFEGSSVALHSVACDAHSQYKSVYSIYRMQGGTVGSPLPVEHNGSSAGTNEPLMLLH